MEDHLIDWLNQFGFKYDFIPQENSIEKKYLEEISNNFSNNIITEMFYQVYEHIDVDNLIMKIPDKLSNKFKFKLTVKYILEKKPIIYNGILYSIEKDFCGNFTFLIRNDYLWLFGEEKIDNDDYSIVEIHNIKLNKDENIVNNKKNKYYQGKTYLLSRFLSNYQNSVTKSYFIINNNNNLKLYENNPNKDIITEIEKGIEWHKNLILFGNNWHPYTKKELYPNLNNKEDYPWRTIKESIAQKINDITLIWNCTQEHKNNAFKNEIFSTKDPKLNSSILGISGKKAVIVDKIIDINRQNIIEYSPRRFKKYENLNILQTDSPQFIVDFETTTLNNNIIIAIIGCITIINNNYEFKTFISPTYDLENEEFNIVMEWIDYMNNKTDNIIIHHWGNAEQSIFKSIVNRYEIDYSIIRNITWNDLCKNLKDEKFVIKGVYSYGLKDISKGLYNLGYIKHTWCDNDIDGKTTLLYLKNEIEKESNLNKNLKYTKIIQDIIYYNKIDCLVLYDIIQFIKKISFLSH